MPPGASALALASARVLAMSLMLLAVPSGEGPPEAPASMPSAPSGPPLPPAGLPAPARSRPEPRLRSPNLASGNVGRSARQVQRMLGVSSVSQQGPVPISSSSWKPSL